MMWRWFRWVLLGLLITAISVTVILVANHKKNNVGSNDSSETRGNFQKAVINEKIQEEIDTTYYDVSGQSKEELIQQMSTLGPECDDGKCFAKTEWAIDWTSPISGNLACEPVSAVASIKYILPRWVDKDSASVGLQNDWEIYFEKLKAHESSHKDIIVSYASDFLSKIKELNNQDYKSCQELENKISQYHATGEIINACTQATEKYDLETQHGKTEDVIL